MNVRQISSYGNSNVAAMKRTLQMFKGSHENLSPAILFLSKRVNLEINSVALDLLLFI